MAKRASDCPARGAAAFSREPVSRNSAKVEPLGAALEAGPASEPLRFRLEILVALAPCEELRARGRHAKTSQDVLRHSTSQLALAHHDEPGSVFLQIRHFRIAVCAHDRVDAWTHLLDDLENPPCLETVGRCDDQE